MWSLFSPVIHLLLINCRDLEDYGMIDLVNSLRLANTTVYICRLYVYTALLLNLPIHFLCPLLPFRGHRVCWPIQALFRQKVYTQAAASPLLD